MILNNANQHSWFMFAKGINPFGLDTKVDVFIVNYESLSKFFVAEILPGQLSLKNIRFKAHISLFKSVIIDEIHRCKSLDTKQTKLTKGIASGKECIIGLTGTPVVNCESDFKALLGIIDRLGDFGGSRSFDNNYQGSIDNLTAFKEKLYDTCFIRREKREVLKDLPEKVR